MNVLWLDDVRIPGEHGHAGADWVKTAGECIAALKTGNYDVVSLDHDLSAKATLGDWEGESTGYDVMLFLEEYPEYLPKDGVRIHSLNPAGSARMLTVVRKLYGRDFQNERISWV